MIDVPVFAGRTEEGDLYILYKEEVDSRTYVPAFGSGPRTYHTDHFLLKLPDGEIRALNPDTTSLLTWEDGGRVMMDIRSEVWSGKLRASREDLMIAKISG